MRLFGIDRIAREEKAHRLGVTDEARQHLRCTSPLDLRKAAYRVFGKPRVLHTVDGVLYFGKVAEVASAETLFATPPHPYTRYLISAMPIPDADADGRRKRLQLVGEPPSAIDPPSGCRFRTRLCVPKKLDSA